MKTKTITGYDVVALPQRDAVGLLIFRYTYTWDEGQGRWAPAKTEYLTGDGWVERDLHAGYLVEVPYAIVVPGNEARALFTLRQAEEQLLARLRTVFPQDRDGDVLEEIVETP